MTRYVTSTRLVFPTSTRSIRKHYDIIFLSYRMWEIYTTWLFPLRVRESWINFNVIKTAFEHEVFNPKSVEFGFKI